MGSLSVRYQYFDKDGQRFVEEIHKVVVHKFSMGDVEDPDLYASQPLWEWQESPAGKFVMKHAVTSPEWQRRADAYSYGHEYAVVAELEMKKLSEFYLRFDKDLKI
jgi:hypothetical protein